MKIADDQPSRTVPRSTGRIPTSAARCRGPIWRGSRKAAASMSATSRCRAWFTSLLCARRTPMRGSKKLQSAEAKKAPGVVAVVTGPELAKVITPWVGVLTHLKGIKSAPQYAIAVDRACWQGEAVCAVVARSRAQAEDACALVGVEYEVLPVVTDAETALDAETPVIHPELGDNLTFERASECRRCRQGFCRSRCNCRNDVRVRPAYRRHQRGPLHRCRLESRRSAPDRLSGHASAAHDAEYLRQAPRS